MFQLFPLGHKLKFWRFSRYIVQNRCSGWHDFYQSDCCRQVAILFLLYIHVHISGLGKCMCPTLVHETHINKTNFIFHIIHLFDGVFDNVETTILVPRLQFSIPLQALFFPFWIYCRDFYILIIVAVGFEVIVVFRGFPPKKPNACQSVDDQLDVTDSHTWMKPT